MSNALANKLSGYIALNASEIDLLVTATANSRAVGAHRDLIREGDEPGPAFVVLEGWACRYKILPDGSRQIMAFMLPGDFCDPHIGSLEQMDHSVGTITSCRIASIPHDRMEALVVATPTLARAFWRAQLVDESISRAWIVSMGRRDAAERIAHLMLELYLRMRNVGLAEGDTCDLPLSQTVVADAVGLTPVHTNRMLRSMHRMMKLGSGTLTIHDSKALAKLAGFDDNYLHRRIRKDA